jgi:hypothetical protein
MALLLPFLASLPSLPSRLFRTKKYRAYLHITQATSWRGSKAEMKKAKKLIKNMV